MNTDTIPAVFTPDNEPYLGRHPLYVLDTLIASVLELNTKIAPRSHTGNLSDRQSMASQVIPQAISISLSIRELIRQGYLFGGHVLVRSLAERATILLYLYHYPEKIEIWNRGWKYRDAPSLAKMFEALQRNRTSDSEVIPGGKLTASMNSLLHAKPESAPWNLIYSNEGGLAHAPSKILERPDLCDDLCANTIPWLAVVPAMMNFYFSDESSTKVEKDRKPN